MYNDTIFYFTESVKRNAQYCIRYPKVIFNWLSRRTDDNNYYNTKPAFYNSVQLYQKVVCSIIIMFYAVISFEKIYITNNWYKNRILESTAFVRILPSHQKQILKL